MKEPKSNSAASAEDFEQTIRSDESEPEYVTLPVLKKSVLMRRPSPMWFMFNGRLPVSMAAKMSRMTADSEKVQGLVESAQWMYRLLNKVMVKPKCVIEPTGRYEISPDMIDMKDVLFIMRWAAGEEVDEASNLSTVRGYRGAAHSGAVS